MLDRLDGDARLAAGILDMFEHSPYFADELLRQPELLDEIGAAAAAGSAEPLEEAATLRRFYRRQMLRIQSESILGRRPFSPRCAQTSALADRVIESAYQIAVIDSLPPANLDYTPHDQMMVIALGRLGMREFDLGSDADLVFVLPDADARRARHSGPAWPSA